jgi:hypothetical protein
MTKSDPGGDKEEKDEGGFNNQTCGKGMDARPTISKKAIKKKGG